jgi:hypothetical protein
MAVRSAVIPVGSAASNGAIQIICGVATSDPVMAKAMPDRLATAATIGGR